MKIEVSAGSRAERNEQTLKRRLTDVAIGADPRDGEINHASEERYPVLEVVMSDIHHLGKR